MFEVNLKKLKPYGDRLDDGLVQLSFTLPVKACPEAKEAARQTAEKLGLEKASVLHMEPMGDQFTFFVVYGHTKATIDFTRITVPKLDFPELSFDELKKLMDAHLDRQLVVIGACTGSDAHTVGIDAILNMKGYAGDYGLERYPKFKVYNLRSQLSNAELVEKAVELKADTLLVSQVVTQRDSHIKNLGELKELLKKEKRLPTDLITIIGGPRIDHGFALKLGFDAGFGPGTKPSHVASFIVKEYFKRNNISHEVIESKVEAEPEHIDDETIEDSFSPLTYKQPASGFIRPHLQQTKESKPEEIPQKHERREEARPGKKRRRGRRGGRRIQARRRKAQGGNRKPHH